jgi:RNA polymerase sigma factor for flagellar operon FliA
VEGIMDDTNKLKLWENYQKTHDPILKEQIIVEYAQLVKYVAGRLSMYLGNNVEYDDLCGYGVFGLIDAIEKFDFTKERQFKTYAEFRIRGAMLDYLRQIDVVPRSVRDRVKNINKHAKLIEFTNKRKANEDEIAKSMEMNLNEYNHYKNLHLQNLRPQNNLLQQKQLTLQFLNDY